MLLIHNFPCENKRQLEREEEYVRRDYQYNINSIKAYITKEEKIENQKQYYKQYRDDNKDKLTEYYKQYRDDNKDKLTEYKKQYDDDNKERITEHRKQKIKCDCGSVISLGNISTHKKTNKHIKFLDNI